MTTATHARETNMNQSENVQIRKSPALAGFLSIMPGAGQVYVGHYLAGFTNILIFGSLITILSSGSVRGAEPFFGMLLPFFWVFNIVDAVRRARLYNLHAVGGVEESLPTDSPLVGGVILAVLGLILTLTVTFGMSLDWLENVWPLAILGAGVYLILRYRKAKYELERQAMTQSARREASSRTAPAAPPPGLAHPAPGYPASPHPGSPYPTPGYPPDPAPAAAHPGSPHPAPAHPAAPHPSFPAGPGTRPVASMTSSGDPEVEVPPPGGVVRLPEREADDQR